MAVAEVSEALRAKYAEHYDGPTAWREAGAGGVLPLFVSTMEPPNRMVVTIGEGLPFGGTWTYEVDPIDTSTTRITIVENGEVYNAVFRFVGRFVIGHDASLNRYRDAMVAELGAPM